MIILRIACDNLYMFKDFKVDFTYDRKINHPLSKNDMLFKNSKIKVRKNLVVMGANASGKTTFGKFLCMMFNFIHGKDLSAVLGGISSARYDKTKDATFEAEFVVDKIAYLLKVCFRDDNLYSEEVFEQKIYKTYDIRKLREKLITSKPKACYYSENDDVVNVGCKSYAFAMLKAFSSTAKKIREDISFWFRFSEVPVSTSARFDDTSIGILNELLPKIDNSVAAVKKLSVENDRSIKTDSYMIIFKNNESLIVSDGDLIQSSKRLSHGTFEAIDFICAINNLSKGTVKFFYIDEQLSHMHSELEAYFIYSTFAKQFSNTQIFFTTHNVEILGLNIPLSSFMFFRHDKNGFNEVIYPSDFLKKNTDNLRFLYENDYFGVLPDYSVLDEFFEGKGQ